VRTAGRGSVAAALLVFATLGAAAQNRGSSAVLRIAGAVPRSVVFVDGIRHGRVDDRGVLEVRTIPAGPHTVVVRQVGFVDTKQPVTLVPVRPTTVTAKRVPLTDEAELAFQRGGELALDGKNAEAVASFREAIASRKRLYPEAQIAMARALLTLKQTDDATAALQAVLDVDPKNGEARTVLGSVLRERGFADEAADEFRAVIASAPQRTPEAHTGLAVVLAEHGDHAGAVKEYRTAIAQNQDAEPVLYQLLGSSLEHVDKPKEAIAAYERFLTLAPSHALAPAVRSIVERLKTAEPTDEGDVNPYAPKPNRTP